MPEFGKAIESFGALQKSALATDQDLQRFQDMFKKVQLFQADVDRITYFSEHPYVIEENEL